LNAYLVVTMVLMDSETITVESSAWYSPSVSTCDLIEFVILGMLATEVKSSNPTTLPPYHTLASILTFL